VALHGGFKSRQLKVNLRKLNKLEVWKEYQIENTNRFAALKNLKLPGISGTKRRDI